MSTKEAKTKKGASAIYVVIFTATLLSVISLSFVRLMLSESARTTNYSLSQSAYNSALAGIEDAKIVLLRYQNCINGGATDIELADESTISCQDYINALNDKDSANDCDLVNRLLYGESDRHETLIQTKSGSTEVSGIAEAFDQAYTCVKVSRKNKNYLTTLTRNYPTKIIPIRTENGDETDSINRIVINWFSRKNLETVRGTSGSIDTTKYHLFSSSPRMEGRITANNNFHNTTFEEDKYKNTFNEDTVVPSVVQATLIQTAEEFRLSQFYSTDSNGRTDRGTITLRSTTENMYSTSEENYSNHIDSSPFANSARKSQNTPLDVKCYLDNNIETASGYACNTDIYVPRPVPTNGNGKRNYTTFFLVLSLPYGDPETEVSVELKSCENPNDQIYGSDSTCHSVDFANVQPMVDSTGRANDLFRRIEARIELIDTYFPIVNYALTVEDPDSDDDDVRKDMYVTKNCKHQESIWDNATKIVDNSGPKNCSNAAERN